LVPVKQLVRQMTSSEGRELFASRLHLLCLILSLLHPSIYCKMAISYQAQERELLWDLLTNRSMCTLSSLFCLISLISTLLFVPPGSTTTFDKSIKVGGAFFFGFMGACIGSYGLRMQQLHPFEPRAWAHYRKSTIKLITFIDLIATLIEAGVVTTIAALSVVGTLPWVTGQESEEAALNAASGIWAGFWRVVKFAAGCTTLLLAIVAITWVWAVVGDFCLQRYRFFVKRTEVGDVESEGREPSHKSD
jgi:hypothetical protein